MVERPERVPNVRWSVAGITVVLVLLTAGFSAGQPSDREEETLRFGVVGFYTPRLMFEEYQPFMDFLNAHTPRVWELVIYTDYQDAIDDLCSGAVAVAYLGPFSYLRAHEQCGVEPVLRSMSRGMATFRSAILVRADSSVDTLSELEGKSFGFGARLSTSSHLIPRSMLLDAGIDVGQVNCVYYTTNERALRAVLVGEVHACGVRDLINEQVLHRGLRVLAQSPAIPNDPLVVSPSAVEEVALLLKHALVDLPSTNSDIKAQLGELDISLRAGFKQVTDVFYDPVRQLAERVFGPGALVLPEDGLGCDDRGGR